MSWMTARRFDWLLRTRGGTMRAWPAADRLAALALLRRSEAARRMLADTLVQEDGFEDALGADAVGLVRMQSVVRRALTPPAPAMRGVRWGAIAACLAAGLYLGVLRADADPALLSGAGSAIGPTMQSASPATVLAALDD